LDTGLQRLYGWERMPEHKAFGRYSRKFDIPATHAVFGGLSGDAHPANSFKAFLEETLSFLQDRKTGLLRLDSGFYSN
jgi:hypothetical protein